MLKRKPKSNQTTILSVSPPPAIVESLVNSPSVDHDEVYQILLKIQKEQESKNLSTSDENSDVNLDEFQKLSEIKEAVNPSATGQLKENSAVESEIVHTIKLKRNHRIIFKDEEIESVAYLTPEEIGLMTDDELQKSFIFRAIAANSSEDRKKSVLKKMRKYWKNKTESSIVNKILSLVFIWSIAAFGITFLPFTMGMISGLMGDRFTMGTFTVEPEWFFIWTVPALSIAIITSVFSRIYKRTQGYSIFKKLENIFYKRIGKDTGVYPDEKPEAYFANSYTTNFRSHTMRVDVDDMGLITVTLPAAAQREVEDEMLAIKVRRETTSSG